MFSGNKLIWTIILAFKLLKFFTDLEGRVTIRNY